MDATIKVTTSVIKGKTKTSKGKSKEPFPADRAT
jgi:hypothetical protein